jgi:hypothetical protein
MNGGRTPAMPTFTGGEREYREKQAKTPKQDSRRFCLFVYLNLQAAGANIR